MNVNTDKMIAEQNKQNAQIASEKPIKDDIETVCYVEKVVVTKTHMIEHKGSVLLTRYMWNNIYKVEFGLDVKAVDLIDYFSLSDSIFIKMAIREGIVTKGSL